MITADLFDKLKGNRGKKDIPQQGSLNGNFDDLLLFVNWTLESTHNENSENLMKAIDLLIDKYQMSDVTIQFLMNQMRKDYPHKTMRIRYLLKQAGKTTENIFRYFYTTRTSKMLLTTKDGTEKSYSVGHYYRSLERATFDKIIDKLKLQKKQELINKHFLELEEKEKRNEKPIIPELPEQQEPCIEIRCKKCDGIIKIPLTQNLETNKEEGFVSEIYSALIKDLENGITFCIDCQRKMEEEGIWKTDDIVSWLKENKGNLFEFSTENFCKEFRNDKTIVSATTIKQKLDSIEMPIEVLVNGDNLKLKIDG